MNHHPVIKQEATIDMSQRPMHPKAKISLEVWHGKVEIESDATTIDQFFENLFIPALLSMGYSKETIDQYMGQPE